MRTPGPGAGRTTSSHAGVAVVGAGVLIWVDWPLTYDGLLNTDRFAVAFLAVCGAALAVVGGVVEGLFIRAGWRLAGRITLTAFAVAAIYPPLLTSGRWFGSEVDDPKSSSAFGLALGMWLLTVGGEHAIARALRGGVKGVPSS